MKLEPSEIIELATKSRAMNVMINQMSQKIDDLEDTKQKSKQGISEYFNLIEFDTRIENTGPDLDYLIRNYYILKGYIKGARKVYEEMLMDKQHIDEYLKMAMKEDK